MTWLLIACVVLSIAAGLVNYLCLRAFDRLIAKNRESNEQLAKLLLGDCLSFQAHGKSIDTLIDWCERNSARLDLNEEAIRLLLRLHDCDVSGEAGSLRLVSLEDEEPNSGKVN